MIDYKGKTVVYVHIRNDTNQIFYVGKGVGRRPYTKSKRNKYWKNITNKVGRTVKIVAKGMSNEVACALEVSLIAGLRLKGYKLANMTSGGESGFKHCKETIEKLRKVNLGNTYWVGRSHTEETKKKLSDAKTGFKHTEETIKKMCKAQKGLNHPRARPANIYSYPAGELVAEGVLITQWAEHNNVSKGNLNNTTRANKEKPHHSKTNPHHTKGFYAVYMDTLK